MPHRHGVRTALLIVVTVGGCNKGFSGPPEELEVKKSNIKVDLPKVPDFTLPAAPGDGSHTVKELRVKGKKLLETEITVKGVITWAYDCATDIRKPGDTDADVAKAIEEDQTKCQRPKFYVGDDANTPPEKSLWIVDVPRPFIKMEIKNGGKEELKNPPPDRCDPREKDPKKSVCPPYKVGDKVTITGTFKLSSPHSERNSDGLLVYKKMTNETQTWTSPDLPPPATPAGTQPGKPGGPPAKPSPEDIAGHKKAG